MPIYAYACSSCGHSQDVLQKMSEAPLTTCPSCGSRTYAKTLTAPAFQLKGSGWYATDFKNNGTAAKTNDEKPASASATSSDAASAPAAAPAAAPAPAPAAAPAPSSSPANNG